MRSVTCADISLCHSVSPVQLTDKGKNKHLRAVEQFVECQLQVVGVIGDPEMDGFTGAKQVSVRSGGNTDFTLFFFTKSIVF